MALQSERSVLIVDRSAENREVLATALSRRGLRTFAAGRAEEGLRLARTHHPDLIVLDLELDDGPPEDICSPFERDSEARSTPLVVLGTLRPGGPVSGRPEFVPKPYHYGPLIRKIEELLDAKRSTAARAG